MLDGVVEVLAPYKDNIAYIAIFLGMVKLLTGFFTCYEIFKAKSTEHQSSKMVIYSLSTTVLGLKLALLRENKQVFYSNLIQSSVDSVTVILLGVYSCDVWNEVYYPLAEGTTIVVLGFAYVLVEDPEKVSMRFGAGLNALSLLVIAGPLTDLKNIMKKKDSKAVPLPTTLLTIVISILWITHGLIESNYTAMAQNCIGLFLGSMQLRVYIKCKKEQHQQT